MLHPLNCVVYFHRPNAPRLRLRSPPRVVAASPRALYRLFLCVSVCMAYPLTTPAEFCLFSLAKCAEMEASFLTASSS